jgi:hypothetical protein
MKDPLMDRTGRSYERAAILEWITRMNSTCPITRQPLFVKDLLPNNKLKKEITQWRVEQGDDCSMDTSHDADAIQIEELMRAIRVWGETKLKCDNVTSDQRHPKRRRNHQRNGGGGSSSSITSFRFMRIFNREQEEFRVSH